MFKILGDDGGDNEFIQYVAYVDNYGPVIEIKTKSINCDNFNIYKIFRSDNKIGNVVSSDWVNTDGKQVDPEIALAYDQETLLDPNSKSVFLSISQGLLRT